MKENSATLPTKNSSIASRTRGSKPGDVLRSLTVAQSVASPIETVGAMLTFCGQALRQTGAATRIYPSEVLRHAALLIRSNALIILFVVFMQAATLAIVTHYIFEYLGLGAYVSAGNTIAAMRGVTQLVFGWIIAAKVGCGIVAELGAMRINEEIDAMEVMGVRSIPYLVSSRIVAAVLVLPSLWVAALAVQMVGGYAFNVLLLDTASSGGFVYFLFLFQNMQDFVFALAWGFFYGLMIVVVACYYGYTAKGGPVGVGYNTAKSMLVNLVLISVTSIMFVQLFYGNSPNAPIAN